MTAWTTDDVYGGDPDTGEFGIGVALDDGMAGVTINGTHAVEETGKHVACIIAVALLGLIVLNRAGIQFAMAAGR